MPTDKTLYNWSINNSYITPARLVTNSLFDQSYTDSNISAMDTFLQKNTELNKLLLDPNNISSELTNLKTRRKLSETAYTTLVSFITNTSTVSPVLANLILLGHISAVESYFREMLRRVILIDEHAQDACREKLLTYSAALTHKREALPDALLEQTNFAASYNITEALKEFLGIKGTFPSSITTSLKDYSNVCQLRHCIVHRFGKLGIKNAIQLDWHTHKIHIDKPIKTNWSSIQEVSQICLNLIKEVNNFTWQFIMMRQIAEGTFNNFKKKSTIAWTWDWKKDKKKFKTYYDIFFSTIAPPTTSNMKMAYIELKNKYTLLP